MDQETFKTVYSTYSRRLYNYALWMTRNGEASQDIIQRVFIKVWGQESLPKDGSEQESWLYTVTRNQCLDFFRKCSRFSKFRLKYAREVPLHTPSTAGEKNVWDMLGDLKEEERSILYLHLRSGYSYEEIAESMDMTANAVRVRAFRALAKLRKRYSKDA